jgi:hypothetical protein
MKSFLEYYHTSRTHLSLAKDPPEPRSVHPVETGAVVAIPQVVFNTAMSGARLKAAFLDAISIQGQACADARRHNGNELLFCSPIALADFSCFLTLQGTVSPTLICLCGRFRPCVGFTIGADAKLPRPQDVRVFGHRPEGQTDQVCDVLCGRQIN